MINKKNKKKSNELIKNIHKYESNKEKIRK